MYIAEQLAIPANDAFRLRLAKITNAPIGFRRQLNLVQELKSEYPHTIQCIACAHGETRTTWDYNCHAFSLRLNSHEEFWNGRPKQDELLPESDFLENLIETQVLEPQSHSDVQQDDILVYYSEARIKHSGVLTQGWVQSKWGAGHLWKHMVAEVPATYGDRVVPFKPPVPSVVLEEYLAHVRRLTSDRD